MDPQQLQTLLDSMNEGSYIVINDDGAKKETDRLFIQEVINDLVKRHGLRPGDKALDLLIDWSRELRNATGMKGRTRKEFFKRVGKYLW